MDLWHLGPILRTTLLFYDLVEFGSGTPINLTAVPWTVKLSEVSSTLPHALSPMAIAANLLSFTRSSCNPSILVVPDAQAAATARIGYSSIILGAMWLGPSPQVC